MRSLCRSVGFSVLAPPSRATPPHLSRSPAATMKEKTMKKNPETQCSLTESCSANLCVNDPDLSLRTWIPGEEVCACRAHQSLPWIMRQWSINRRRPAALESRTLSYQYLVDSAPKPRFMTAEQRERAILRLQQHRFERAERTGVAALAE
jgi:hypothetical protein